MLKTSNLYLVSIISFVLVFLESQEALSAQGGGSVIQEVESTLSKKIMLFNIPAQAMKDGVVDFGLQSGVNIIVSDPYFLQMRSNRVMGRYQLGRALEILLEGTGLGGVFKHGSNSVVIDRSDQKTGQLKNIEPVDSDEYVVEDVFVVSSRHWEESVMDVPLSISVVGSEELDKVGVQDLVQIGPSLVNVSLSVARGSNTTLTALIRGVGQMDPLAGFEQGVGVYVDNVYLSRPQGAVLDIYDVERIEILRGPQGTLYGRNTIGGAIRYVTKSLSNQSYLRLKARSGQYRQRDLIVSGGLSGLDEGLKLGASVGIFRRDGFGNNHTTGEDNYDKKIKVGRVVAEYSPLDNLLIRITADATRDDSNARSGVSLYEGEAFGRVYDSGAGASQSGHPASDSKFLSDNIALSLNWQFSPNITFESVTALRDDESQTSIDFDAVAAVRLDSIAWYRNEQLTQEARMKLEGRDLSFILGVFYLNARYENALDVESDDLVVSIEGQDYGAGLFTFGDAKVISRSVFFNAIYDIYDVFELSLGARYTHEKDDVVIVHETYAVPIEEAFISPFFGGSNGVLLSDIVYDQNGKQVAPRFHGRRVDRELSPKLSLSWFPEGEMMFFSSVSSGFKGGGFDPRGDYTLDSHREGFLPERLISYELGMKSRFLDDAFLLSLVGFFNDYKDLQVAESVSVDRDQDGEVDGVVGMISNSADVEMYGVELESSIMLMSSLDINVSYGYIYYKFNSSLGGSGDVAEARFLPSTPERSFSFSINSTMSIFSGELSFVGDVSYRSGASIYESSLRGLANGGYSLFNSSVVWVAQNSDWKLGLHGRNLGDKRYRVSGYSLRNLNAESVYYGDPRTLSVSVARNF